MTGANIMRQGLLPVPTTALEETLAGFPLAGFSVLIFYAGCVQDGTEPAASA